MDGSPGGRIKAWVLAARPKTLVASVVPVAVGAGLAFRDTGSFPAFLFILALLFCLLVQIGTNFSNDYYDYGRGADHDRSLGPARAVASGMIAPRAMFVVSLCVLALAFGVGVVLMEISETDRRLLWVGVASVLFAIAYTGGPLPLAYNGLGDLFVILFFGLVAVGTTHYVLVAGVGQDWRPNWVVPLGIGFAVNNLLVVNNTRDCPEDGKVGKKTLVVLLGRRSGLILYGLGLVVSTLLCPSLDPDVSLVVWVFPLGLFCLFKLSKASTRQQYGFALLATSLGILAYGFLAVLSLVA